MSHHVAEHQRDRPGRQMDSSALRADRVVLGCHRRPDERAGAAARGGRRRHNVALSSPNRPRFRRFSASARCSTSSTPTVPRWSCWRVTSPSAPTHTATTTSWSSDSTRTPSTSSTSRTSGATRSPPPARRAPTERPPTSRCSSPATRARRCRWIGRRAARHHRQDAGATGHPRLRRRLGSPDRRSIRGGQRGHRDGHPVDRRGDRDHAAHRLPLTGHHDHGACHGAHRDVRGPWDRRFPGERRGHRTVDVFDQHPHAAGHRRRYRLRHLPARPLSRATQRRHGPGGRLLRHVPRDIARDFGFGSDRRRRGVLPVLHPHAVLPEPRASRLRSACSCHWSPR